MFYPFLLLIVGHLLMSLLFYLNHKLIFHGKLGKLKFLRGWKRIHTNHHKDFFGEDKKKALGLLPFWGWLIFLAVCSSLGFINIFFAIGMFSYVVLYEWSHSRAHKRPKKTKWAQMHIRHHTHSPRKNFATFYVFWDKLFKTAE
jgi:sterol desaturase/sphingolipid hydroxylase (fatty acid hydroxylase superfamily)